MSARALARSRDIAARVTASSAAAGIFGVELFVKGDDVWFSEVSPRPHDTGMVTMCTQAQSEFELHARAILGLPVDVRLIAPGASAVIYGGVEARGIRYEDVAHALAVPVLRPAALRQARGVQAAAHGRCARHRRDIDDRARAREGMRAAREAARRDARRIRPKLRSHPRDAMDLVIQAPVDRRRPSWTQIAALVGMRRRIAVLDGGGTAGVPALPRIESRAGVADFCTTARASTARSSPPDLIARPRAASSRWTWTRR